MDYVKGLTSTGSKLDQLAEDYINAHREYLKKEKVDKHVLAALMKNFEGSVANREMEARASEAYRKHKEEFAELEAERTATYIRYQKEQIKVEIYRSLLSHEKAQMNLT